MRFGIVLSGSRPTGVMGLEASMARDAASVETKGSIGAKTLKLTLLPTGGPLPTSSGAADTTRLSWMQNLKEK